MNNCIKCATRFQFVLSFLSFFLSFFFFYCFLLGLFCCWWCVCDIQELSVYLCHFLVESIIFLWLLCLQSSLYNNEFIGFSVIQIVCGQDIAHIVWRNCLLLLFLGRAVACMRTHTLLTIKPRRAIYARTQTQCFCWWCVCIVSLVAHINIQQFDKKYMVCVRKSPQVRVSECSKKRAYREIYYDIIFPYQCPIVVIINISFTCIRLKWVFVYSIRVSWPLCFSHSLRFVCVVCVYACSRRTLICISIVTNVIACRGINKSIHHFIESNEWR